MNGLIFFESALQQDIMTYQQNMQPFYDGLLMFIIDYLPKHINAEFEEFEQETKSIYLVLRSILKKLLCVYQTHNFTNLMNFVYQNIVHHQVEMRLSAMLVFEAVVYSGKREDVEQHIENGYDSFFMQFNDENLIIQKYNLFIFRCISKMHTYILEQNSRLKILIDLWYQKQSPQSI